MAIQYRAELEQDGVTVNTVAVFDDTNIPPAFSSWVVCSEDVQRGWTYDGSVFSPPVVTPPTPTELEAEVQDLADELIQRDERMMALALATVDLRMADIPAGATTSQVRQQFKDRVISYLRERRGI